MAKKRKRRKKRGRVSSGIVSILVVLFALVIISLAFLSIMAQNRKSELANVVTGELLIQDGDIYRINEVIHGMGGSVLVSNVEEYGKQRQNVTAILHYYNTTREIKKVNVYSIGLFTDGFKEYNYVGQTFEDKELKPGESLTYKLTIERANGTNGLYFIPSKGIIGESYKAMVDLSTQTSEENLQADLEKYGIKDAEVLDLSLAENEGQIITGRVLFDAEGQMTEIVKTEEEKQLAGDDVKEVVATTGKIEGINRQLTQEEQKALNNLMTEEDIDAALARINLPGYIEWGYVKDKQKDAYVQRNIKGYRDTRSLKVMTQQDGYSENLKASGKYLKREDAIRLGLIEGDKVDNKGDGKIKDEYGEIVGDSKKDAVIGEPTGDTTTPETPESQPTEETTTVAE